MLYLESERKFIMRRLSWHADNIDILEEKMKKKGLVLPISCMIASLTFTSAFAAGRYGFS